MKKRTEIVKVTGIRSSFTHPNDPTQKLDISELKSMCWMTQDSYDALQSLVKKVEQAQGSFYISDLYRTWAVQESAYEDWINHRRTNFAAPPGESFHMAGRAVDIDVYSLKFPNTAKKDWLRLLWGMALPLGWFPIIQNPDMGKSECWHFEYPGKSWSSAYQKMENKEVAACAILDTGIWDPKIKEPVADAMFLQAQLVRLGCFDVVPDGDIGPVTIGALRKFGLDKTEVSAACDILRVREAP